MIVNFIDYLKERSQTVKQVFVGLIIFIVLWSAVFVDTHHAHTFMEKIPGFWSFFGIVSCVVLIYFASWFGKSGIMTREDYYDN